MLVTLYINTLPVDTLRLDKIVYVDVVKLWKTLRINDPVPTNLTLITNDSDKSYTVGNYATQMDTMEALLVLPSSAYDLALGETMILGLSDVLDRFWATQPEFTPLY